MTLPSYVAYKSSKELKAKIKAIREYRLKHDIYTHGLPFTEERHKSRARAEKLNTSMMNKNLWKHTDAWKNYIKKEAKKRWF